MAWGVWAAGMIDARIGGLGDWRGEALAQVRELVPARAAARPDASSEARTKRRA
ncbi:MAG: hypothetical protein ACOY4K_10230 [Pseudomonadota bacterium]